MEEIKENDYNLNIPRYVDTFEEEEQINLAEVSKELVSIDKEIEESMSQLKEMFKDLHGTNEDSQKELEEFMKIMGILG